MEVPESSAFCGGKKRKEKREPNTVYGTQNKVEKKRSFIIKSAKMKNPPRRFGICRGFAVPSPR